MRIDLLFPAFPPRLDGIGDHTALLGKALADAGASVRVWTAEPAPTFIPDVAVHTVFDAEHLDDSSPFLASISASPPDWLIVQYNPFSYGRYGWAWHLLRTLRRLRAQCPSVQIALMAHESFVDSADFAQNWTFAVMTVWQRMLFARLGALSDVIFLSTEPRTDRFREWFPDTPVHHLPVGSNIPVDPISSSGMRRQLGVDPSTFVVGLFGTAHVTRLLNYARAATAALADRGPTLFLYVGPDGDTIRDLFSGLPLHDAGPLPAAEVSHHLQAMDLYLAPFERGVSTRRGSFHVGLQHGLPTLSTSGSDTDALLLRHHPSSFVLSPHEDPDAFVTEAVSLFDSPARRSSLGSSGRQLYESTFNWMSLARRLLNMLPASSPLRDPARPVAPSSLAE